MLDGSIFHFFWGETMTDLKDSGQPENDNKDTSSKLPQGSSIGFGIILGIVFGAAFDNLGLGIAFGILFGAAVDANRRKKAAAEENEDSAS